MKLINDLNLTHNPVQLKFAFATLSGYPGFYHEHQGMEILYIHRGVGDVFINRQLYEIRDHTMLIFRPYQLHRIRMDATPQTPYVRSKLLFEPSFFDGKLSFAPELQSFFRRVWKQEPMRPVLYDLDDCPYFPEFMNEYADRFARLAPAHVQEASVLFLIEFFHRLRGRRETELLGAGPHRPKAWPNAPHAEKIVAWLERHLDEPLDLDRLAGDLHLSKPHLSRLFKRSTGSTISEFLNIVRVQRACRLLETTDKTVEQIARDVGIGNTSYFCEMFKAAVGQTPLQYKIGLRSV